MDKYIYPAVFDPCEEGGYTVTFPDLPGIVTEGDTIEEALSMAKDALELHLYGLEVAGDKIPSPTAPDKLKPPSGGFINLIQAWMPSVRAKMATRAIKKTLTIPQWLNEVAEKRKVNYSHIFQYALKQYLGVSEPLYLKNPQHQNTHKKKSLKALKKTNIVSND